MLNDTQQLLEQYGKESVFEKLSPLLLESRIERLKQCIEYRIKHIHIACEKPYDIHNAFATIRTAEAFGLYNIHIISNKKIKTTGKATTKGSRRWTNVNYYYQTEDFFNKADPNMQFAAADLDATHSLEDMPLDKPLCVIFGNEQSGISDEIKEKCHYRFKLPMHGMTQSFNLSIAAALTLNKLVERYRSLIAPFTSDLNDSEKGTLLTQYMINSFGIERTKLLLK